jgi:hypothetical protein
MEACACSVSPCTCNPPYTHTRMNAASFFITDRARRKEYATNEVRGLEACHRIMRTALAKTFNPLGAGPLKAPDLKTPPLTPTPWYGKPGINPGPDPAKIKR